MTGPVAEDWECGECGGELDQVDRHTDDGTTVRATVRVFRCPNCETDGELIETPDDTLQRGCVDVGATQIHDIDVAAPIRAVGNWLTEYMRDKR
jgi:hypothetical protein